MAVNATAVWRVRPSGSNTNGGGYDAGISGAGTDYSQQNSAQASGTAGTAAGTTAFSDVVAAAFTSAMVGNALYLTGTGLTTGWYFVTAFTDASHVTLDRSPGTGTTGTWHLGGGWADFWTNTTSSGPLVPGNVVYILGGASPSYGSPDYTTSFFTPAAGSGTAGLIRFVGDPNTPSNNGFSGYPLINSNNGTVFYLVSFMLGSNLFIFATAQTSSGGIIMVSGGISLCYLENVIMDLNGYDIPAAAVNGSTGPVHMIGCEVFSSHAKRSTNTFPAIQSQLYGTAIIGCNVHDNIGPGISISNMCALLDTVVAKNGGAGVTVASGGAQFGQCIKNCTIDGNIGSGIVFSSQAALETTVCTNNIISNHTQASTYGITVSAGTAGANNKVKGFVDYNTFYNNTADLNAISYGVHDTSNSGTAPNTISSSPYVASSTENYTLA